MAIAVFLQAFFFAGIVFYGFSQPRTSGNAEPAPQEMRFTVKPTGELKFQGTPNTDIIDQLMASSQYLASSDRQLQKETNIATERINLLTICFLGSSFIVAIACVFWSINANHKDINECQSRIYSEALAMTDTTKSTELAATK